MHGHFRTNKDNVTALKVQEAWEAALRKAQIFNKGLMPLMYKPLFLLGDQGVALNIDKGQAHSPIAGQERGLGPRERWGDIGSNVEILGN